MIKKGRGEEMKRVRITVMRKAEHADLMEQYENPLENPCEMEPGKVFFCENGIIPDGFCGNAWDSVGPFAERLANGEENFFDGWMKNRKSAMISCNDGFRPVSFYLEVIEGEEV